MALPKQHSAPTTYVKVLDILIGPSSDALNPIDHQLLDFVASAPIQLISNLSDATVDNCYQRWKAGLRSQENGDVIRSLHLASCLHASAGDPLSPEASIKSSAIVSPKLSTWLDKCRTRFSQAEVGHVIQRTILSVLKWCSEATEEESSAVSSVRLAGSLLCNIDAAHIRSWVSTNGPIMRKLSQKLVLPSLSARLQAEALVVLSMLDEECKCPEWAALMANVCRTIVTTPYTKFHGEVGALRLIISRFVHVLDQSRAWSSADAQRQHAHILEDLVGYVVAGCQPRGQDTVAKLGQIGLGTLLVEAFGTGDHQDSGLRLNVYLRAMCEHEVPEWWPLDLSSAEEPQNCISLAVCTHGIEAKRQNLCLLVTKLTIRSASLSSNTVNRVMFDLLERRLDVTTRDTHCQYPVPYKMHSLQQPFRVEHGSSSDWKVQMQMQLTAHSQDAASLVEHYVVKMCQDLQRRCDDVEIPLREARAEIETLQIALHSLENDLFQSEKEKQLLCKALKDAGHEHFVSKETISRLGSEIADLQARLIDRKLEIRDLEDGAEKRSIDYQNHLTEVESSLKLELGKLQQQLVDLSTKYEEKLVFQRDEIKQAREEAVWLKEQMDHTTTKLHYEYNDWLQKLKDEHSIANGAAQSEIERLNGLSAVRAADVDRLNNDLHARDLDLDTSKEQRKQDKRTLDSLQLDVEASKADCQAMKSQLDEEKQNHAILSEKEAKQSVDLGECLSRIAQLEQSASALGQQCKTQAKALEKAQRAEQSVLAILQNARQPLESPLKSTQIASPSQQTPSPTTRLLEGSFISEEDVDYSDFIRLGENASRRRRTLTSIR